MVFEVKSFTWIFCMFFSSIFCLFFCIFESCMFGRSFGLSFGLRYTTGDTKRTIDVSQVVGVVFYRFVRNISMRGVEDLTIQVWVSLQLNIVSFWFVHRSQRLGSRRGTNMDKQYTENSEARWQRKALFEVQHLASRVWLNFTPRHTSLVASALRMILWPTVVCDQSIDISNTGRRAVGVIGLATDHDIVE